MYCIRSEEGDCQELNKIRQYVANRYRHDIHIKKNNLLINLSFLIDLPHLVLVIALILMNVLVGTGLSLLTICLAVAVTIATIWHLDYKDTWSYEYAVKKGKVYWGIRKGPCIYIDNILDVPESFLSCIEQLDRVSAQNNHRKHRITSSLGLHKPKQLTSSTAAIGRLSLLSPNATYRSSSIASSETSLLTDNSAPIENAIEIVSDKD